MRSISANTPTASAAPTAAPVTQTTALSMEKTARMRFFVAPTSASRAAFARLARMPDVNTSTTPTSASNATAAPAMVTGAARLLALVEI